MKKFDLKFVIYVAVTLVLGSIYFVDAWPPMAPAGSGSVTNGDAHDHSGGDGAQIDHTGLSNIGTNTHAQIDTHITAHATRHNEGGADEISNLDTACTVGTAYIYRVGGTDVADADVADDITASNYLPLAGGTLTNKLTLDENGVEFQETDTITDCSTFAATGGGIFYDDSEGKFKKCQDNVLTDLDTDLSSIAYWETSPRTSAPGSPAEKIFYLADNSSWDPCGVNGSVPYWCIYDGADYIAIIDIDGVWLISSIETTTLLAAELNDTSSPHTLIEKELKNTILSNSGAGASTEYDFPARGEGWFFICMVEAAQNIILDPNGTEQWYLNGTQGTSGQNIENVSPTVGESISCWSTESAVYCKSSDSDWAFE